MNPDPPEALDISEQQAGAPLHGADVGAYRGLLRNRNYRLWFTATLGSGLGDWTGLVALQALVVSLAPAGSRTALFGLGGIMMARLLPSVIFGPIAGVMADRYDRKRLMVITAASRGLLFVGIAFSRDLIALFALTFLVECLTLLYMAARDSTLPQVVDRRHLTEANQLNLLVTYGTLPLGAVIAAAMVPLAAGFRGLGAAAVTGTVLALLVNAGMFFVTAVLMARLEIPARRAPVADADGDGPSLVAELREGIEFIRELPLIRALISGVVAVFFGAGVVVTLGPEFVRTSLGRTSEDWYGLMIFVGVGVAAGVGLTPLVTRRFSKAKVFPVGLTAAGALAMVIALLPTYQLTQLFGSLLGAMAGMSAVIGYTLLHEHTNDEVRARTFAAFYVTTRIAMFAALGLAPFVAGGIGVGTLILGGRVISLEGVRITILLAGLIGLAGALTSWRRMYRALREDAGPARPIKLVANDRAAARAAGVFIAFEGVEGSGKSTQVRALAEALKGEGHDVLVTREPGGAPVAERIRGLLLDPRIEDMHPRTEALLYAAARTEHVEQVILPALAEGKVVLCDRFLDSSLAYQGYARGLGPNNVSEINRWAVEGLLPDAVVLLHLDPEAGLRRVAGRGGEGSWDGNDRLERESLDFHRRVESGYLQLARRNRGRFVVVDATADAGSVARQIRSGLHVWLPLPEQEPDRSPEPT